MHIHELHFFPYTLPYLLGFFLLLGLLLVLLELRLISYAYERVGLTRRGAILILFAALLGSGINIPLVQLPAERLVEPRIVDFFGMQYVIPTVVERQSAVIAINVGGALIPLLLVLYLIARYGITLRSILALAVVTLVVHALAQPVRGVGIALPPLLPSVVTAVVAVLFDRQTAPRTAFIAGTLGTLLGADILNLGIVQALGAPVVSIGGAGTFDGVFVTGILAVLLAAIPGRPRHPRGEAGEAGLYP
jgi:uncharacterized membrane protein